VGLGGIVNVGGTRVRVAVGGTRLGVAIGGSDGEQAQRPKRSEMSRISRVA
jgi:hypothetical protein